METSNSSTGPEWSDLPLFAGDTPASLSQRQVIAKVKKILATCGLGYDKPLASYAPIMRFWRMSAGIFPSGEQPSLPILPPSGMTRNGELFQQPPWVPIIGATESSLWPTPTTQEVEHPNMELTETGRRKASGGGSSHSVGLADAVHLWPTPTAVTRPMEGNVRLYRAKVEAGEMTEAEAEAILGKSVWEAQGKIPAKWPTPTADDASNVNPKPNRFRGLVAAVNESLWPTPRAAMGESRNHTVYPRSTDKRQNLENKVASTDPSAIGGKLNPTWVEWLMGFPPGWTDLED